MTFFLNTKKSKMRTARYWVIGTPKLFMTEMEKTRMTPYKVVTSFREKRMEN